MSEDNYFPYHKETSHEKLMLLTVLLASVTMGAEHVGPMPQPLLSEAATKLWTTAGNVVPVCWETAGYDRAKKIMKDAVFYNLELLREDRLHGLETVPYLGDAQFVRIASTRILGANDGADGSAPWEWTPLAPSRITIPE